MQIEFKESGGVANLNRRLLLDNGRLSVTDRGKLMLRREIEDSALQKVEGLVAQLVQSELRRRYGGKGGMISDPTRMRLRIELAPGESHQVEVRTDPSDPPPEAFSRLIEALYGLFRAHGVRLSNS